MCVWFLHILHTHPVSVLHAANWRSRAGENITTVSSGKHTIKYKATVGMSENFAFCAWQGLNATFIFGALTTQTSKSDKQSAKFYSLILKVRFCASVQGCCVDRFRKKKQTHCVECFVCSALCQGIEKKRTVVNCCTKFQLWPLIL